MNIIRDSLKDIHASDELKRKTLRYLEEQGKRKKGARAYGVMRYVVAAVCVFLLMGSGGYFTYARPVSYISIDVNPSIELGLNRFDRVVSVNAYNEEGNGILAQIELKNIPYLQAINRLLEDKNYNSFLTENPLLVVTVISEHSDRIVEEMGANELLRMYDALTYTSDGANMEEAHRYGMSFGKYRAYLELSQYDESITVEECHEMTMGEIHNRIESCLSHERTGTEGNDYEGVGVISNHYKEQDTEGGQYGEPGMEGDQYKEPDIEGNNDEGSGENGIDDGGIGIGGSHHEEPGTSHGEHHR